MIKKSILSAALLGFASFAPGAGSAATASYDFAAMADAYAGGHGGQEGSWDQVTGGSVTDNGITLVAKGAYTGGEAHAFLDSKDSGRPGGLGVCHSGFNGSGLSECSSHGGSNTSDDNVTLGETLTLLFDKAVFLADMVLRDAHHFLFDGDVIINGSTYSVTAGMINPWVLKSIGTLDTFVFDYVEGSTPDAEFYITSLTVDDNPDNNPPPVPLPAGGFLLLGGLGVLGAMKRKRKA